MPVRPSFWAAHRQTRSECAIGPNVTTHASCLSTEAMPSISFQHFGELLAARGAGNGGVA